MDSVDKANRLANIMKPIKRTRERKTLAELDLMGERLRNGLDIWTGLPLTVASKHDTIGATE